MVNDSNNLNNLMGMAGTAVRAGNWDEAISYYNRVLEADPTHSEAWLGKGRAAGWLSSLANVRIAETKVAFGHAIATAPQDLAATIKSTAHDDMVTIIVAIYGMAARHYREHGGTSGAYDSYMGCSAQLVDSLSEIEIWKPNDRRSAEQMVLMTREMLNVGVSEELKAILLTKMTAAN